MILLLAALALSLAGQAQAVPIIQGASRLVTDEDVIVRARSSLFQTCPEFLRAPFAFDDPARAEKLGFKPGAFNGKSAFLFGQIPDAVVLTHGFDQRECRFSFSSAKHPQSQVAIDTMLKSAGYAVVYDNQYKLGPNEIGANRVYQMPTAEPKIVVNVVSISVSGQTLLTMSLGKKKK